MAATSTIMYMRMYACMSVRTLSYIFIRKTGHEYITFCSFVAIAIDGVSVASIPNLYSYTLFRQFTRKCTSLKS